jgi:hypothetical protein
MWVLEFLMVVVWATFVVAGVLEERRWATFVVKCLMRPNKAMLLVEGVGPVCVAVLFFVGRVMAS